MITPRQRFWQLICVTGLAGPALAATAPEARAADPLGFYFGGSVGQGRLEADLPNTGRFGQDHPAFKVMLGTKPLPLLGAEIEYLDLGQPSENRGIFTAHVRTRGAAALGVLYLPVPLLDIYAKAGVSRLESTADFTSNCPTCLPIIAMPAPVSRSNTGFVAGIGVQYRFGPLAVRGEYERFNAAGGNPSLLSLGATWTF